MGASDPFRADLHLHTNASDGELSPSEVICEAAVQGMEVVAVTDHDTMAGVSESLVAGETLGIRVLPGIELSVGGTEEIHLLGYGVTLENEALRKFLNGLILDRRERMQSMLERLHTMGMLVAPEETEAKGKEGRFMGRMNLARAMVSHGYVRTVREAFTRYLDPGKPAYVPRRRLTVPEGIERLRTYGALVSLAHPGRLKMDRQAFLARLPGWIEAGLSGMEAYHPSHDNADMRYYDRLARERGLLVTGGSDFHGRVDDGIPIGAHLHAWKTARDDTQALQRRLQLEDRNL